MPTRGRKQGSSVRSIKPFSGLRKALVQEVSEGLCHSSRLREGSGGRKSQRSLLTVASRNVAGRNGAAYNGPRSWGKNQKAQAGDDYRGGTRDSAPEMSSGQIAHTKIRGNQKEKIIDLPSNR